MAVFRARALAVAAGVPAAFAALAALLTVGSPAPVATAAEPAASTPTSTVPFAVTHPSIRTAYAPMPLTYRVRTADPVAFITIDDGVHKDAAGLRFVEERQLPVTAFVSAWTVKDRARYFERITRWGSIQNHTATHASLERARTDLDHEICYSQRALTRSFGTRPWMIRPPYGAGSTRLDMQITAGRCGLTDVVLWDAVVADGRLSVTGGELRPGSVILLHFTPDLEKDLRVAVRAIRAAGLVPADLAEYRPAS